jgi:uncharacterized protein (DUF1810 family)
MPDIDDPFALKRFLEAQEDVYAQALSELRNGRKRSHWIWYIFPQLDGLGSSATSKFYAIKSMEEARRYLDHPALGARLKECAEAVLAVTGSSVSDIFGYPDNLKFRSSMTLFSLIAGGDSVFGRILDKYFNGKPDERTVELARQL